MNLAPQRLAYEREQFAPMLEEAIAGDGRFLVRLRDEWEHGVLRFERKEEVLLGIRESGIVLAVGGISFDPYDPLPGLGRVRHVYVLRVHRSLGLGGSLLTALLSHARGRFDRLRLTTKNAGGFYESFGFIPSPAPKQTHVLLLKDSVMGPEL